MEGCVIKAHNEVMTIMVPADFAREFYAKRSKAEQTARMTWEKLDGEYTIQLLSPEGKLLSEIKQRPLPARN